jgi:hypothetical protein
MKFKVVFHPEFHNDIQEAVQWYNVQQNGLVTDFFLLSKNNLKNP